MGQCGDGGEETAVGKAKAESFWGIYGGPTGG